jgi:hypothetical protein
MRKILTTAAFLLAFSCPAFAGEMHTPGSPAPPTATSNVQEPTGSAALNGEMHTPGVSDTLTAIVLDVLSVLPTLL